MDGEFYNHVCRVSMPPKYVCKVFLGNEVCVALPALSSPSVLQPALLGPRSRRKPFTMQLPCECLLSLSFFKSLIIKNQLDCRIYSIT